MRREGGIGACAFFVCRVSCVQCSGSARCGRVFCSLAASFASGGRVGVGGRGEQEEEEAGEEAGEEEGALDRE